MTDNSLLNSIDNNLNLKICPDGISYVITDENQRILLRQEFNIPVGTATDMRIFEHFFSQPELQILSENVNIAYESNEYQLIPNDLFSENDLKMVFNLEHGASENESIIYKVLPKWGAHFAFRMPTKILSFFEEKYPEAEIEHHILKLLKKRINKNESALFLNIRKGIVDILAVQNHELLLLNSFQVKTNEDICYFVLNAYEKLQLDKESFLLRIDLNSTVNEELISLLKQYVKELEVI